MGMELLASPYLAEEGGGFYSPQDAARARVEHLERWLLFWPYKEPPPAPLATNLGCGSRRRFRVDLPPGTYTVRVVTTNPSWTNRNFLVSGMVSAQDAVRLADVVQDRGALVGREFTVAVPTGKLDLAFGGPTGWAIAANDASRVIRNR